MKYFIPLTVFLLAVWIISGSNLESYPSQASLRPEVLEVPVQLPVEQEPFEVRRGPLIWKISPRAWLEAGGVAVSSRPGETAGVEWDTSLISRDLALVWGNNAGSGVYRNFSFMSRDGRMRFLTDDLASLEVFDSAQAGGFQLLAANEPVYRALNGIRLGDQVMLMGFLCDASRPGRTISTSLTREDSGADAAEVLYVQSVQFLARSSPWWNAAYRISGISLLIILLAAVARWFLSLGAEPAWVKDSSPLPQNILEVRTVSEPDSGGGAPRLPDEVVQDEPTRSAA